MINIIHTFSKVKYKQNKDRNGKYERKLTEMYNYQNKKYTTWY